MKTEEQAIVPSRYFVENLGVRDLLWLVRQAPPSRRQGETPLRIGVVYQLSRWARGWAALLNRCGIPIQVEELDFDFIDDVRMSDGSLARTELMFHAAPGIVKSVESDPEYLATIESAARQASHGPYLHAYLSKRIFADACSETGTELRSILVVEWICRTDPTIPQGKAKLYLKPHWLTPRFTEYASRRGIQLGQLPDRPDRVQSLLKKFKVRGRRLFYSITSRLPAATGLSNKVPLRIAVEKYMRGVNRNSVLDTDFFWYRKPNLPSGVVFGYFAQPGDQPTLDRQVLMKEAGIGWINQRSFSRLLNSPRKRPPSTRSAHLQSVQNSASPLSKAMRSFLEDFYEEYDRWAHFFQVTQTRIHVSRVDVYPQHEALHAALADLNGISVSIQYAIEKEPYLLRRTATDVHFVFTPAQAERERLSGSFVQQLVTSGYLFDDAFEEARRLGPAISAPLRSRGMDFIVCYLDEKDGLYRKWIGATRQVQADYTFLCDKLEADPTLGLILKPKQSQSLPERLGPVWARLKRFIDSGRCILMKNDNLDERVLPCVAASAADVAINHAGGATAGLESFLAGTRTFLIRHHAKLGPFSRFPEGTVLFESWSELWQAVEQLRANPDHPDLGNWETIIDELACPRDGKASERINQYLVWLYESLSTGQNRQGALQQAARSYAKNWGEGWTVQIQQPFPVVKGPQSLESVKPIEEFQPPLEGVGAYGARV